MQRHRILRGYGLPWSKARAAANSAAGFRDALLAVGGDPEQHAELARKLASGPGVPERKTGERAAERSRMYHSLKAAGATPLQASRYCQSKGVFQWAMRRLEKGFPL